MIETTTHRWSIVVTVISFALAGVLLGITALALGLGPAPRRTPSIIGSYWQCW